jgi:ankyrin repeat protein
VPTDAAIAASLAAGVPRSINCRAKPQDAQKASETWPDLRDARGTTALMMTCEPQYREHCKVLLDAGANVDLARDFKEQAIHIAFFRGLKPHIKLLIDAGADINTLADYKLDPSCFSLRSGEGGTCLMRAASGNRVELFPMLFAVGADVNYVSGTGNRRATALTVAAKLNATAAFDALLNAGADPSDEVNYVALCYGANSNNMHIVRTMLAAGAPIDYTVGDSIIALGRAVMQRHTKMVKYLLEQGADVNKAFPTKSGSSTALEYACLSATVWSSADSSSVWSDAESEFVLKPVSVEIVKMLLAAWG